MTIKRSLAAAALTALCGSASATDGYFSHGYGSRTKAMGGAGSVLAMDALNVAANPANLVNMQDRFDVGVAWFNPERGYTVEGNPSGAEGSFPLEPGSQDSDSTDFVIPHFAYRRAINDKLSFGFAVFGNGGMNTDYRGHANPVRNQGGECPSGTYCAGAAGVDLSQLFVVPSIAAKLDERWSIGIAPIVAYQRFKATGLASFAGFSESPDALSDQDYDDSFGYGARFGVRAELLADLSMGASWQSQVRMEAFNKYAGLFADQGEFDIPSTWNLGLAYRGLNRTTLALDFQRINYGDINSISGSLAPLFQGAALGSSNGPGFGWQDVDVIRLGIEYQLNPKWQLRAGYNHSEQPFAASEVLFNILAPGVVSDHYTAGASYRYGTHHEFTAAFMYAPTDRVVGANPLDPQQTVSLEMDQRELEFGYSYLF